MPLPEAHPSSVQAPALPTPSKTLRGGSAAPSRPGPSRQHTNGCRFLVLNTYIISHSRPPLAAPRRPFPGRPGAFSGAPPCPLVCTHCFPCCQALHGCLCSSPPALLVHPHLSHSGDDSGLRWLPFPVSLPSCPVQFQGSSSKPSEAGMSSPDLSVNPTLAWLSSHDLGNTSTGAPNRHLRCVSDWTWSLPASFSLWGLHGWRTRFSWAPSWAPLRRSHFMLGLSETPAGTTFGTWSLLAISTAPPWSKPPSSLPWMTAKPS